MKIIYLLEDAAKNGLGYIMSLIISKNITRGIIDSPNVWTLSKPLATIQN